MIRRVLVVVGVVLTYVIVALLAGLGVYDQLRSDQDVVVDLRDCQVERKAAEVRMLRCFNVLQRELDKLETCQIRLRACGCFGKRVNPEIKK